MSKASRKKNRPRNPGGGTVDTSVLPRTDYDQNTPKFCFAHIGNEYDVKALPKEQGAALACTMQDRARLTWQQLHACGRHGQGYEWIPRSKIKASVPQKFEGHDRFMVFRYHGKLPMVGVRINDTFHVLWIARTFNDLYQHN